MLFVLLAFMFSIRGDVAATPTPSSAPAAQELVRTPGGMEVTFPASYFVSVDPNSPNTVMLTSLEPDARLANLRIQDVWDIWEYATTPSLNSVRDEVLSMVAFVGTPIEDFPEFDLPNGRLIVLPYTLDTGSEGGLYALLALAEGRIVVAEILVDNQTQLTALLQQPQQWVSILASIRFNGGAEVTAPLPQLVLEDRPLSLSEMPPNTIVFATDVTLTLASPWLPASSQEDNASAIIEDTITLAHNRAEALATIRIAQLEGSSFVDWRSDLLAIMAPALGTGAQLPVTGSFLRNDGRAVEQYVSPDLALNLFFVDLGGDQAAYVLNTMIEPQEARRQVILDSLRTLLLGMTRFERIPPGQGNEPD